MKYFLHDTNAFQDEKITELYMHFGYEGLGLFYTCLEKLAMQEKPVKTEVLKKQLNVGKKLEKCWKFMESLGILSSNNGETFNKQLLNFSEKYQIKSEKNRKKVSEWREKQADTENVTGYVPVRNAPKVKESKVKESKVNIDLAENEFSEPDIKKKDEEIEPEKTRSLRRQTSQKTQPEDSYNLIKDYFLSFYKKEFDEDYYFEPLNGAKIKSLMKKISFKVKEKNGGREPTPEELSEAAMYYISACYQTADEFLKQNFTLSILDSQFNKLFIKIKNGKSTRANSGANQRNGGNRLTPAQRAANVINNRNN